jgi:hypothetical protein
MGDGRWAMDGNREGRRLCRRPSSFFREPSALCPQPSAPNPLPSAAPAARLPTINSRHSLPTALQGWRANRPQGSGDANFANRSESNRTRRRQRRTKSDSFVLVELLGMLLHSRMRPEAFTQPIRIEVRRSHGATMRFAPFAAFASPQLSKLVPPGEPMVLGRELRELFVLVEVVSAALLAAPLRCLRSDSRHSRP